jgi:Flp pilus assembly protein protease CpaA
VTAAVAWARGRPLGSVFAAAVAAAVIARYGAGIEGLIAALTCAVLVVLSVIDVETRRLPNNIVLPTAALVLVARLLTAPEDWATWLGAGLGAFACFFLLALVYPGGMGMGDVKLALLLGFALGSAVVPALMVGMLAAGLAGVVLLARDGRQARRRTVPFGPFMAFGAIAVVLLQAPFADVEAQTRDTRFNDPSYLAAKLVVWLDRFSVHYEPTDNGWEQVKGEKLDFLSVGVVLEDPGDIEYRYVVARRDRREDSPGRDRLRGPLRRGRADARRDPGLARPLS